MPKPPKLPQGMPTAQQVLDFIQSSDIPAGKREIGKATFSSDILYDTLRKYDPDHLMLQITREEALRGLVDFGRIEEMIARTRGRVDHVTLPRVTPLAAPLFLEPGRVPVQGAGAERLLAAAAERLLAEAGLQA